MSLSLIRCLPSVAAVFLFLVLTGCGSESAGLVDVGPKAGQGVTAQKEVAEAPDAPLILWEYPALPYSAQQITYIKLLKSELGVETIVMDLPKGVTDADFRKQVNKHNESARLRIESKHGQGALGRVRQKANDEWDAKVREFQEKSKGNKGGP